MQHSRQRSRNSVDRSARRPGTVGFGLADLPPKCRIEDGIVTTQTCLVSSLVVPFLFTATVAFMFWYYGFIATRAGSGTVGLLFLLLWLLSVRHSYRFDLKRRVYEKSTHLTPFVWRKSNNIDDVAGIYAYGSGLWLVRRSSPKQNGKLADVEAVIGKAAAERWAQTLAAALEVPSGTELLGEFPERNGSCSCFSAEQIAFRKRPFQRLVAAVFSKAFAAASLVLGGGLSFALVRHYYLPVHLSLATNIPGVLLSGLALYLLKEAGPQDIAFDIANRTYTLTTGLLYFSRFRTGRIDEDLRCIQVLTPLGKPYPRSATVKSNSYAPESTLFIDWKDGSRIPVGTFGCRGEALAHAVRLAAALGSYCIAPEQTQPG